MQQRKFHYNPNERKKFKPSALQQQANQATTELPQKAANFADRYLGGAGGRKIAGGVVGGTKGFVDDISNTRKFARRVSNTALPGQDEMPGARGFKVAAGQVPGTKAPSFRPQLAKMPEKTTRSFPPPAQASTIPSVVEENAQQPTSAGYTPERIESLKAAAGVAPGQENSNFVGRTFTAPGGTMTITGPPPKIGQRTFKPNTKYNTGSDGNGLDVKFAPGTSQGEMRRFMAQPTRPGTRQRSGILAPGEMSAREKYFNRPSNQPKPESQKDSGKFVGWRERTAKYEADKRAEADLATTRLRSEADLAKAGMTEASVNQRQAEANEIARTQAAAAGLQAAQAEKYGADANMTKIAADLQQRYVNATDPAEKASLERELMLIQGKLSGKDSGMTEKDKAQLRIDLHKQYLEGLNDFSIDKGTSFTEWAGQQAWLDGIFGRQVATQTYSSFEDMLEKNPNYKGHYSKASPEEQERLRKASDERAKMIGAY